MPSDAMGTPAGAEVRPLQESWVLPRVLAVEAVRVRYSRPRRHVTGGRVSEHNEAVEVTIRTDGPIPVRALAPELHIGGAALTESEPAGANLTRFFGFQIDLLQDGAEIALGWSSAGFRPEPTGLTFRVHRVESR
jgi:hypothetical protein